jgi:hypothetical protein
MLTRTANEQCKRRLETVQHSLQCCTCRLLPCPRKRQMPCQHHAMQCLPGAAPSRLATFFLDLRVSNIYQVTKYTDSAEGFQYQVGFSSRYVFSHLPSNIIDSFVILLISHGDIPFGPEQRQHRRVARPLQAVSHALANGDTVRGAGYYCPRNILHSQPCLQCMVLLQFRMYISKFFTVVVGRRITDEVDLLIIQSNIKLFIGEARTLDMT